MKIRCFQAGWLGAAALTLGGVCCGGGEGENEKSAPPPVTDDVTAQCGELIVHFATCGMTSDMEPGAPEAECVSNMQGFCTYADMDSLLTFGACVTQEAQCVDGTLGIPEEQMMTVFMGDCSQPMADLTERCSTQVMSLATMLMGGT